LSSDIPGPNETVFNDLGEVTLRNILRDPGTPGFAATPSELNRVTVTRYRVVYKRSDGLNREGIDVPFAFDGAFTLSITGNETAVGVFELVRHDAKLEPPLAILGTNLRVLTAIAEVTFYGHDQAGNEVAVTGAVQVNFAAFV
jgi:hypothetical protein